MRENHGVGEHGESQINSPRRAALLESFAMDRIQLGELAAVLRSNHLRNFGDGTALPTDLPAREKLVAAGYVAVEDFDGASALELRTNVPTLTRTEAAAALAALGA
jgi:hypothetical protein